MSNLNPVEPPHRHEVNPNRDPVATALAVALMIIIVALVVTMLIVLGGRESSERPQPHPTEARR